MSRHAVEADVSAVGFDSEKYLEEQTRAILDRVARFGRKLYLEFGGKLLYDHHAARVLPGFDPNVKVRLLQQLEDRAEILLCIYAGDIERKKVRADFGITYDSDALKLIDDLRERDLTVRAVVITRYEGQPAAASFKQRLERRGVQVHTYNRDVEAFPLLNRILTKIQGGDPPYRSPTDMGVNRAGFGVVDDAAVRAAAVQEVIRRYFRYACEYALGLAARETVQRAELLMRDLGAKPEDRAVVEPARRVAARAEAEGKGHQGISCGAAMVLRDGHLVTGRNSPLMHAASSLLLNAIKQLAGIPDAIPLLAPSILESIARLKSRLGQRSASLDLEETLTALGISATTNPAAELGIDRLTELRGCEAHMTHIPTPGDEAGLRRLGVNLTTDPSFSSKSLFVG
jgi:uncharacterized protein (UPF0371 family)